MLVDLASRHPERIAHFAAFILSGLMPLARPLVGVVNITANSLFGSWRAEVYGAGSAKPCATASFRIVP